MFWIYFLSFLFVFWIILTVVISLKNHQNYFHLKRFFFLLIYIIFLIPLVVLAIVGFVCAIFSRAKLKPEKVKIEDLQPGDIVLTGSNGLSSLPIKIANILTNGVSSKFWTHVAVHIDGGRLIEAQPSGVRDISIVYYFDKKSLIKVFRHKYLGVANPEAIDEVVQNCKNISYYKDKYGFLALIYYVLSICMPNIFEWVFNDEFYEKLFCVENKYFCSELAAEAYKEAGHPIAQYDSWRVKPSDFLKNPFFNEVKSGAE